MRSTSKDHYRPDIVLFVNGIPFCIIECKRPDLKEPLKKAVSQHLRNQQEDGIRQLYVYAQLILSIATNQAAFATSGTPEKFWSKWKEKSESESARNQYTESIYRIKNKSLTLSGREKLFKDKFRYVRAYFEELMQENLLPTVQDEYLYNLCRPERLLDLSYRFIVFEAGEKKIARFQQYFTIKKTLERITQNPDPSSGEIKRRKGGVIWHTQGSGKSLTMVMLAQAIALDSRIHNPKIILVTDRLELDDQLTTTFRKCGIMVDNATTGQKLVELLQNKSDAIITTIINKFETALKRSKHTFTSPDIFVLVDEGHRTQYGSFNIQMRKTLPNACFIAFTGTPLMKKEKNTAVKFGGIIDPAYTVDEAVEDGAVVPILYEGRLAMQKVSENPIDTFFNRISEPLTKYQKADLKKKFSRADQLNIADQKIYAIAWDISLHYRDNWQGTGFKGQLVCQNKDTAIKYKTYLDEIGIVSSEVVISAPDEREGEDSAYGETSDRVKRFWKKMMEEHGNPKKYEKNIISRFKNQPHPEIVIVVDKLTTGFDAPANTILYLTRSLKEHKLLQTIARVNRVYPEKDFGYVIDYYGVLEELDKALVMYSAFEDFDEEDLKGTLVNIQEEIKKLPQRHSELWDIFKSIKNKQDEEAYEYLLRDESIRVLFYEKLSLFSRILKIALSTIQFHENADEKVIDKYKKDVVFFLNLRTSVMQRYSDSIDYKKYESQIQKLIDKHIQTEDVKVITEQVNIFDKENFRKEVEKTVGEAAKADKIATRTARHINEKMDEDPAFYKKFSEMLKDTIREYEEHRISEIEYLNRVNEIMESVLSHTDSSIPEDLKDKDAAKAYYGLCLETFNEKLQDEVINKEISKFSALSIHELVEKAVLDHGTPIIDWPFKSNITGKLQIEIGDYLIDEVRDRYNLDLSISDLDELASKCIDVAKLRYKS